MHDKEKKKHDIQYKLKQKGLAASGLNFISLLEIRTMSVSYCFLHIHKQSV